MINVNIPLLIRNSFIQIRNSTFVLLKFVICQQPVPEIYLNA
jgi:hypothetical protein